MKRMIFGLVMAAVSSSAMAGNIFDIYASSGSAGAPFMVTSAPTVSLGALHACFKKNQTEEDGYACGFGTVTFGPISTSTLLALVLLKEEVQNVEQDAYNMLAGEGISDALKELIENAKAEHEELQNRSDKDIATLLIDTLEIK